MESGPAKVTPTRIVSAVVAGGLLGLFIFFISYLMVKSCLRRMGFHRVVALL